MLGLALINGGCAARSVSIAAPTTQAVLPSKWAHSLSGAVDQPLPNLSTWWEQFGDTSLTSLVNQALQGSPDVRSAEARIRQARAERQVAEAGFLPSVTGSAAVSEVKGRPLTSSPSLDASWQPDVFGGTRASVDAADAEVSVAVEDLHSTQVSLSAEIARTYTELRTTQRRLDILRSNVAAQSETLQLTDFRAQAGLVSSVDVEQARANLEQNRAQIPSFESSIAQQTHRLSMLVGVAPDAFADTLSESAPLPEVPESVVVGIPAETLRQRPDVRAAEQRVIAETARLAGAKAERFPRFSLSGSIGSEIVKQTLTGGTSLVASAATSVAQTLFDGGRIRQQVAAQSAVRDQRLASYESTVLTALEEVENALVSFEKSGSRLESLRSAELAAQNAALLAQTQYSAGLADFQRVLDTQRTVLSVQDSVAVTEGDRLTTLVQLFTALGGGWSSAAEAMNASGSHVQ
jgi:NodT family efflux transporter outer membrane factor (OMF) lipoprotein